MKTDCITDDELAAWAQGSIAADRITSIQEHVSSCDECRTVAAELVRTTGSRPQNQTLGRYELREPVGAGGMGTVYAAWDPKLERQVAVKLLHEAAVDGHRAERFLFERQVLASLEHPHIARLLDAGETEEGRPWFAMDFVDGRPLDLACDAARLTVQQRVELLLPVLRAVSAAHQLLIVHRDLKPSNILVDTSGEPRLLDFGIARLLEGASGLTQTGMTPMTPAYASPEQVRREPAAVTTDVYSAGVVLYELLTGVSPYATKPGDVEALLVAVTSGALTPPSQAVERATDTQLAARSTTRERLRAALQGDFDAIVMMALRREPRDRYQSMQALSDDLVAALDGRPTLARRGDRAYRAALFVRRNRALVAGVAAAFVALSIGLVATIWQARRAETERDLAKSRFEQVRALARAVLFDYHDGIADLAGSTPLRQRLVKDAQGYLEALAQQAEDDDGLRQELASSYLKLGDVQGDPFAASLGDTQAAAASYRDGLQLAQRILDKHPGDATARNTIADARHKLASIDEVSGNLSDALAGYEAASTTRAELLTAAPDDVTLLSSRARDELAAGQALLQLSRVDDAAPHIEQSIALRRAVVARQNEPLFRRGLAASLITLSNVRGEQGRFDEGLAAAEEALTLFKALSAATPESADYRRGVQNSLGVLQQQYRYRGGHSRVVELAQQQLELARGAVEKDPENASAHHDLVVALSGLAQTLDSVDRYTESWEVSEECLALQRTLLAANPANMQTRRDLMQTLARTAWTAVYLGKADLAIARSREVLAVELNEGADNETSEERRADAWHSIALGSMMKGDLVTTREASEKYVDGLLALLAKDPTFKRMQNRVALAEAAQAEFEVRIADATNTPADWERADQVLTRADLAAQALEGDPGEMAALAKVKDERAFLRQRVDAGRAGKKLPPLPKLGEDLIP